jgi:plastocyanin
MAKRSIRRVAGPVLAVAALALVAPAAGATTPKVSVTKVSVTKVSVDDNFFEPKRVTVTVGDRVTWKWDGYVAHNVKVEKGPQKFKSAIKSEGTFSRVIRKPGVYRIVCTLHPGMTMKLTATDVPDTTTSTAPPPST